MGNVANYMSKRHEIVIPAPYAIVKRKDIPEECVVKRTRGGRKGGMSGLFRSMLPGDSILIPFIDKRWKQTGTYAYQARIAHKGTPTKWLREPYKEPGSETETATLFTRIS